MNEQQFDSAETRSMSGALPFTIISARKAFSLFIDEYNNPFSWRNTSYEFRNAHEDDEHNMDDLSSYFGNAIVIDLLRGQDNWLEAFSEEAYLTNLSIDISEAVKSVIRNHTVELFGEDMDDYDANLAWKAVRRLLDVEEIERPYHYDTLLSPAQLTTSFYYRSNSALIVECFSKIFNINKEALPNTQVQWFRRRDNGSDPNSYQLNRLINETQGPKLWESMPWRYLMIPVLSAEAIGYYNDRDQEPGDDVKEAHFSWASDDNFKPLKYHNTNAYGSNNEYGNAMFFDYHDASWKVQPNEWGRKFRECSKCRGMYSTHFLTWYKELGGYGSQRNRICFYCNAIHTQSYNVEGKTFVSFPDVPNENNYLAYRGMDDDQYVNFIHGNDAPNARGSRTFMVKYIDDFNFQTEGTLRNDEVFVDPTLSVDARKYYTWMYQSFKNRPGTTRNQLLVDLQEFRYRDEQSSIGNAIMWDESSEWIDLEAGVDTPQNSEELLSAYGLDMPNVFIYQSDNPLAETIISVRIDGTHDNREWYIRRPGNPAQEYVDNDGWIAPDHGLARLNVDKNEYRYTPDFYYVNYMGGSYYSYPIDRQMEVGNNTFTCPCVQCEADTPHDSRGISHPHSHKWHNQTGLHMGLELELIARDSRLLSDLPYDQLFERTVEIFHPQRLIDKVSDGVPTQLLYAKRDGSLPSGKGVEYISQPMTMDAWHAVPDKFWKFVESNYKAFQQEDVGIHIHFPWASMNLAHAYAMLSALNTLQMNPAGVLLHIAQRPTGRWAAWDLLQYRDTFNVVAEVAKSRVRGDSEKYKAINTEHTNTIELRYFNSNAKGPRVLKNLEFVDALFELTKKDAEIPARSWDADRDMPTSELIDIVAEYSNTSSKYKLEHVHNEDVPFGHFIEQKIFDFVRTNSDRYPNLFDYMSGITEDDDLVNPIELEDIGYWEEVVVPEETNTVIGDFNNFCFQTRAESITIDGLTYNIANQSNTD